MRTIRRALPAVAWLLVPGAAIAVLAPSGGVLAPPPLEPAVWPAWALARDPFVTVFTVVRLLALALSWYSLAVGSVAVLARVTRAAELARVADAIALPLLRGVVRRTLGLSLAATLVAGAAPASAQLSSRDGGPPVVPGVEEAADHHVDDPATSGLPPPLAMPDRAVAAGPADHEVVAGESLWSIAHDALAHGRSRTPSDAEVADYWERVIELNRSMLADPTNPDLIFPGQSVRLPPVTVPDDDSG